MQAVYSVLQGAALSSTLLGALSGKQELSLQNLTSLAREGGGRALLDQAESRGLDPALLTGIQGILGGGGGGDSADGGGGGLDPTALLGLVGGLTGRGEGESGAGGFLKLLQGGGAGSTADSIKQILLGLAKSYFNVKGQSDPSIQAWQTAGAAQNSSDESFMQVRTTYTF